VGRLPELWQLHTALHPHTTRLMVGRAGPAVALVRRLGGVGKTLLAEEYALRFGAAYPGGVCWLRAYGSREDEQPTTFEELAAEHDRQVRAIARLGLRSPIARPMRSTAPSRSRCASRASGACGWSMTCPTD
jgi:hypothetical protein